MKREVPYDVPTNLQKELKAMTFAKREDVYKRLTRLPKITLSIETPRISLEEINIILFNNAKSAFKTLFRCGNYITDNIQGMVLVENYDVYTTSILDNVAATTVTVTSNWILQHLLMYIQADYIFDYVKDNIVDPILLKEIEDTRLKASMKDSLALKDTEIAQTIEDVDKFIYDLMISNTNDMVGTFVQKYKSEVRLHHIITRKLDESVFFVPKPIYEMFSAGANVDLILAKLTDFFTAYRVTYTEDAMMSLFNSYSVDGRYTKQKMLRTLNERKEFLGLVNLKIVDGFTAEELRVMNRILTFTKKEDDKNIIRQSKMLANIDEIVEKNKAFNAICNITNDVLTITKGGRKEEFAYRLDSVVEEAFDPFNAFGSLKNQVKAAYLSDPLKTPLCVSGITKIDYLSSTYEGTLPKFRSPIEAQGHRMGQINRLLLRLEADRSTVEEAKYLLENGTKEVKYLKPTQIVHYVVESEKNLLLILAETEGLYRKVAKFIEDKEKMLGKRAV